jgi:hypothetical protein
MLKKKTKEIRWEWKKPNWTAFFANIAFYEFLSIAGDTSTIPALIGLIVEVIIMYLFWGTYPIRKKVN